MDLVAMFVGLALLTLGRRLYWLFVGGVGFAVGATVAGQFAVEQPEGVVVAVAVISGLLGAIVAVYLQRFAVAVAGFAAGGEAAIRLLHILHVHTVVAPWFLFGVGGLIGAMLLYALFDWALIGLSSFVGAALCVQAIPVAPSSTPLLYAALLVLGIVVQTRAFRGTRPRLIV
jgi:hypothetical protein